MTKHRFASVAVPLLLAVTACSNGAGKPTPTAAATTTGDPCAVTSATTSIPDSCAPTLGPTSNPSDAPKTSQAIPPQTLAPDPGQLAAGGNNKDPALTTETFEVTIPAGTRLKVHATCLGSNRLSFTTKPTSDAEAEFNCGFNNIPSEVGVSDPTVAKAPTHYQVIVVTTPPSRWWVNVSGTTEPTGAPI